MISRRWRRLSPFCVFLLVCFWLFTDFPSQFLPKPPRQPVEVSETANLQYACPTRPPHPAYSASRRSLYKWRDLPLKYPVESFAQLPTARPKPLPKIQYDFEKSPARYDGKASKPRLAAIEEAFRRSWGSYKEYAWMKDELRPISGGTKTTFGGWGATLVDNLDTLWIMGLKDEFEDAVNATMHIDFKPEGEVNMFETTIRYLGGLLSAYDLTDCKDYRLLEKAIELGDMIYASYDTPNRMPITRWSGIKASEGQKQKAAANGIIAEMASASLEFTRLSQLTGDMRYFDAISRITNVLDEQQNKTKIPGLWPVGIDVQTPDLTGDTTFSLGARADSAYEYLGKTYQLLRGVGPAEQYKRMYERAMDAVVEYLLFRPMVPDEADILMPTVARGRSTDTVRQDHTGQHLACFVGGMFSLGGRLFSNETHVDIGRKVTDACVWAYKNSPKGVMPEVFAMPACPSLAKCKYDPPKSVKLPGFSSISDTHYLLRPEAIESVFYMYRITGDTHYQNVAWEMFEAIDSLTRTQYANAALRDVTLEKPEQVDSMESFWMAETLKYFYLIFSKPTLISLDEWVFNTEAHPFRLV